MIRFIALVIALLASATQAQTVTPNPVQGLAVPFEVALPVGGQLRVSARMLDTTKMWPVNGSCVKDYISRPPRGAKTLVGWTCAGAAVLHLTSTESVTYTCAYDGAILEPLHLTMSLNGAVFYDKGLAPQGGICYVTPAAQATTTFTYPTITFDNSQQARESAYTVFYLEGYLIGNYTVTSNDGEVICDRWLRDEDPSIYVIRLVEVGMKCAGTIPANTISTVTLQ